ncbi:hypothetical protein ACI2KR_06900 [Pseudomonas luteola]
MSNPLTIDDLSSLVSALEQGERSITLSDKAADQLLAACNYTFLKIGLSQGFLPMSMERQEKRTSALLEAQVDYEHAFAKTIQKHRAPSEEKCYVVWQDLYDSLAWFETTMPSPMIEFIEQRGYQILNAYDATDKSGNKHGYVEIELNLYEEIYGFLTDVVDNRANRQASTLQRNMVTTKPCSLLNPST